LFVFINNFLIPCKLIIQSQKRCMADVDVLRHFSPYVKANQALVG